MVSQQRGGLNPYEALAGKTFCITCFYVDESSGTVKCYNKVVTVVANKIY